MCSLRRLIFALPLSFAVSFLLAIGVVSLGVVAHATHYTATWIDHDGWDGVWSDPDHWSIPGNPAPFAFPYNNGDTYDVVVPQGTVTLDQSITIEGLELGGGMINGTNNLDVVDILDWSGGAFDGTGMISIGGGTIDGVGTKDLGQLMTIGGTVQWQGGSIGQGADRGEIQVLPGGMLQTLNPGLRSLDAALRVWSGGVFEHRSTGGLDLELALDNRGTSRFFEDATVTSRGAPHENRGILELRTATVGFLGGSFTNLPSGTIAGRGLIDSGGAPSQALVNSGTLSPGNPGSEIGTLTIAGDYNQSATGTLEIDLGGPNPGDSDLIVVQGMATLDGMLDLRLIDCYVPLPGESIPLLSATGGISSAWDPVLFECGNATGVVLSDSTTAYAYGYIVGDINDDGSVDDEDVPLFSDAMQEHYGEEEGEWVKYLFRYDMNGDGKLDFDDIPLFIEAIESGSAFAGSGHNVPESPAGLLCFVAVAWQVFGMRVRGRMRTSCARKQRRGPRALGALGLAVVPLILLGGDARAEEDHPTIELWISGIGAVDDGMTQSNPVIEVPEGETVGHFYIWGRTQDEYTINNISLHVESVNVGVIGLNGSTMHNPATDDSPPEMRYQFSSNGYADSSNLRVGLLGYTLHDPEEKYWGMPDEGAGAGEPEESYYDETENAYLIAAVDFIVPITAPSEPTLTEVFLHIGYYGITQVDADGDQVDLAETDIRLGVTPLGATEDEPTLKADLSEGTKSDYPDCYVCVNYHPGDFDCDGDVDGEDLSGATGWDWGSRFGVDLDVSDLMAWQREYGWSASPLGAVSVPEPFAGASVSVALMVATQVAPIRRRRFRRITDEPRSTGHTTLRGRY